MLARALVLTAGIAGAAPGGDWQEWCGHPDRNSVSPERNLPDRLEEPRPAGAPRPRTAAAPTVRDLLWSTPLGVATYGTPVVADGKVLIGGCESHPGDHAGKTVAALWCLREADGAMLWRFRSPYIAKLYNRSFGITATPTVEGNRVYVVGHLGEVLCLDINGLADGNDGPFMGEAALMAQGREFRGLKLDSGGRVVRDITPGRPGRIDPSDADIVWRFDMVKELNTKPYNSLTSAALVVGDYLFVGTGNTGTLSASRGGPKPTPIDPSPALIVLDKRTGKLLAVDDAGIHRVIFHGAHASPAYGVVNGRPLVFYGAAGRCYAFDARFQPRADGQPAKLKPAWEFNCLASGSYADPKAPRPKRAEVVATPVFHKNRVYMAIGNDLIHSGARAGPGRLVCIDATQQGDISATGLIWSLDTIRSSSSTVAIKDGLVYAADASGMVYCLDADTGRVHWTHPTGPIWASPLIADGKVYLPTHDRGLLVLAEGRTKRIITDAQGTLVLDASAVAANGVLYIASHKNLYALKAPGSGK